MKCNYHRGRYIPDQEPPFSYAFSEGGKTYTASFCSAGCLDAMYRDKREAIVNQRLNKASLAKKDAGSVAA